MQYVTHLLAASAKTRLHSQLRMPIIEQTTEYSLETIGISVYGVYAKTLNPFPVFPITEHMQNVTHFSAASAKTRLHA